MTQPLLPRDPARIGGHRLVARLGAGGMGVVYLGRSDSGALAAVKVVHPDLAADPDFRARFRREAEAARRVRSPWATPVTGADTEADTPWLATAFVPGPSLEEAVRHFGRLPQSSVRPLGRMLAAALREVHTAGIVHRDVKPANVLLAADGPRLIDFGIARSTGQTAITRAGVVAGTPGFLAPEQAEARSADIGPAADVFSLGCLLAYAATGRAPFGGASVEAVLYRTVHGEPDLAGVEADEHIEGVQGVEAVAANGTAEAADGDEDAADGDGSGLLALLRACLAKDPAARPTAAQVEARLTDDAADRGGWLPDAVVRDITDRSARLLALPDIEPTLADTAGGAQRARIGRRRLLALASGAGVTVAGGGAALWALAGDKDRPARPADGERRWALGVHADLSGAGKAIGLAQEHGARLAVEQYNARRDKPFALDLRTSDDAGSVRRSKAAAVRLVDDPTVLAVLGPTTTATAVPALDSYDQALLPVLFVVPGSLDLLSAPCRSAVHCRARDSTLAYWIAVYLVQEAKASLPGILMDRTADSYAADTAMTATETLRGVGRPPYPRVVPAGLDDLGETVDDILGADVDAFVYAGFSQGAAGVARHLAAAGFHGTRMGTQALVDPAFLKLAGGAAEGWVLAASFVDASAVERTKAFADAHRRRFRAEAGYFAAEAYDAANLAIEQLVKASRSGRPPSRRQLVPLLRASRHHGITKSYAFDEDDGGFAGTDTFLYRVEGGRFRYHGDTSSGKQGGGGE